MVVFKEKPSDLLQVKTFEMEEKETSPNPENFVQDKNSRQPVKSRCDSEKPKDVKSEKKIGCYSADCKLHLCFIALQSE